MTVSHGADYLGGKEVLRPAAARAHRRLKHGRERRSRRPGPRPRLLWRAPTIPVASVPPPPQALPQGVIAEGLAQPHYSRGQGPAGAPEWPCVGHVTLRVFPSSSHPSWGAEGLLPFYPGCPPPTPEMTGQKRFMVIGSQNDKCPLLWGPRLDAPQIPLQPQKSESALYGGWCFPVTPGMGLPGCVFH